MRTACMKAVVAASTCSFGTQCCKPVVVNGRCQLASLRPILFGMCNAAAAVAAAATAAAAAAGLLPLLLSGHLLIV